jgi:hypothetical protein
VGLVGARLFLVSIQAVIKHSGYSKGEMCQNEKAEYEEKGDIQHRS